MKADERRVVSVRAAPRRLTDAQGWCQESVGGGRSSLRASVHTVPSSWTWLAGWLVGRRFTGLGAGVPVKSRWLIVALDMMGVSARRWPAVGPHEQ
jgi:hypothetical protein